VSGIGESYECAVCHGMFVKGRDDEDAMAEMEALFRETSGPQAVCDTCWIQVMAWAQLDAPETLKDQS